MLSCEDCENYLEAFLDQELDVKESLDVEAHLRHCPTCASYAEGEQLIRLFVREQSALTPLDEGRKLQIIRQAIEPTAKPSLWGRLWTWIHPLDFSLGMATAAAVLLLWVFNPLSLGSKPNDMTQKTHRYVQEASMAYQTYKTQSMPLEVEDSNDKVVVAWFNRQMPQPLPVPCITDQATKLLGGRLCRLFDRKSATFVYKRNNADIFLFAFHGNNVALPGKHKVRLQDQDMYVQEIEGRPVAVWHRGGVVYSMIGDVNRDDLLQVANTLHYR